MCKTKETTRSIPQADLTRNNHAPAWPPSYTITQTEETKQIRGQRRMAQTGVSKTETGYQRCCSDHSNTSDGTFEDQHECLDHNVAQRKTELNPGRLRADCQTDRKSLTSESPTQ